VTEALWCFNSQAAVAAQKGANLKEPKPGTATNVA